MRKKQVWRYYCDFCNRGGLSSFHMQRHENSCTANPNRVCRMHEYCEDKQQKPLVELTSVIKERAPDWNIALRELRDVTSNCPACILAAMRQGEFYELPYDYKSELASFWADINNANSEIE